jgi:hypothetical protein
MRGFIFLEFLVAAFLLLSTVNVAMLVCASSAHSISKDFLFFTALTAQQSYSAWKIADNVITPDAFQRSLQYLPEAVLHTADPVRICWSYLALQECVGGT